MKINNPTLIMIILTVMMGIFFFIVSLILNKLVKLQQEVRK